MSETGAYQIPQDIIVETSNPKYLDETIKELRGCVAVVVGGGKPGRYVKKDGGYVVRCFAGLGFLKFDLEYRGYGRVIKELDELIDELI